MNITVYLASSIGNDPKFLTAVRELGTWIGTSANTLVYGGSKTGLMGVLAQSSQLELKVYVKLFILYLSNLFML